MAKSKFPEETRVLVEKRADLRCEYCKASVVFSPHRFTIDHIIPSPEGGSDALDNLAYACFGCNRTKHSQTKAIDPFSQLEVALFHPRNQVWKEHFAWGADFSKILGLTPTGRATVAALQLNRPHVVRMRLELIEVDRHPPELR